MLQHIESAPDIIISDKFRNLFWTRVEKSETCWRWRGSLDEDGYGTFRPGSSRNRTKRWKAHRFSWLITHGSLDPDILVCHTCDNPPCCNPAHLFLGTHADNHADRERKGRGKGHLNALYKRTPLNVGSAKITPIQAEEIRTIYATGGITQLELAARFHISQQNISNIVRRASWDKILRNL